MDILKSILVKRNWQTALLFFLIVILAGFVMYRQFKMGYILPKIDATRHAQVTLSGVFTILWNGGAHYIFTDTQGRGYELIVSDETLKELGGPLAIDRRKVTVTGTLSEKEDKIIVVSLRLDDSLKN